MIAKATSEPHKSQKRLEQPKRNEMARKHANDIETLREAAAGCRNCPLYWETATQTVFGEGSASAPG